LHAHAHGRNAAKVLAQAIAFRDAAWRVLWAVAHDEKAAGRDMKAISHYMQRLHDSTGIVLTPQGFCRRWQGRAEDPERAMWRMTVALESWLLSDELPR